jgi:hypothetical protein
MQSNDPMETDNTDDNPPEERGPDETSENGRHDVVEAPELLLRAEATIWGRSVRQWRRMLVLGSEKDARWMGIALLVAVVAVWIWITYNR